MKVVTNVTKKSFIFAAVVMVMERELRGQKTEREKERKDGKTGRGGTKRRLGRFVIDIGR